ncbi:MAG: MFS transporter [Gammaproteobacteria bacterium]|nr:MFS transporter [Gammaproteobacteria bacterium]
MRSATDRTSLLAYMLPAIPLAMLGMPLIIYVPPFYAAELGLELAAVGGIFFMARAWDAITDPLIGHFSDQTRGAWGRRKPWIVAGVPLLMISLYLFLSPPLAVDKTYLFVVALVFYVAWTTVQIPYLSWGAELSRDYTVRTRINGFRETGTMIGVILATLLPVLFLREENPALRDILWVYVAFLLVLIPFAVFVATAVTPKAPFVESGKHGLISTLKLLSGNRPFLRLIIAIFFLWLGGSVMNASLVFTFEHILEFPRSAFLKFVLIQYVIGIACLPLWVKFGNRYGRHRALVWGGFGYLVVQPLYLLVSPGDFSQLLLVALVHGPIISVIWVMPPALIADTIEYGMMKGGSDDAAIYMAVYNFMVKVAFAGGVGIALPLLSVFGFLATGENSESAIRGLIFVGLFLPAIIGIAGAALLYNHPINKHRHGVIRRWLARKNLTPEINT